MALYRLHTDRRGPFAYSIYFHNILDLQRGIPKRREMRTMNNEPKAERSRGIDERKIYDDGVPENDLDEFQFK